MRVNASNVKASISGHDIPISGVAGFYDIGTFRYCSGPKGAALPNFCSSASLGYTFDITDVFRKSGIPNLGNANDKEWTQAMNLYRSTSKFISSAYIIGFAFSALSLIFGLMTFCLSRVTNLFTTIASLIGTLFIVLASGAASAVFASMAGTLYSELHQYNIDVTLGTRVIAITWISAAAAIVATFFWSCGCCCGRDRSRDMSRGAGGFKGSEYERLHDPHHPQAVPLQTTAPYASHGYEPYRGHSVV